MGKRRVEFRPEEGSSEVIEGKVPTKRRMANSRSVERSSGRLASEVVRIRVLSLVFVCVTRITQCREKMDDSE